MIICLSIAVGVIIGAAAMLGSLLWYYGNERDDK